MKPILLYAMTMFMVSGVYSCKCSQKSVTQESGKVNEVAANEAANNLINKRWQLVEIMGRPVAYSSEDNRLAYIQFRADGTVSGHMSCNTFSGNYTAAPQTLRIRFSNLVNTLKMCLDMEIETELKQALERADNYNVNGDQLLLNRARMAPLARFEAIYLE